MDSWIFVVSHGRLCEAIVESTEMIYGKIEKIKTFPLLKEVAPEDYLDTIEQQLKEVDGPVIFLADLYGGTPANVSSVLIKKYGCIGFTGANIPLLITLLEARGQGMEEAELSAICKTNYEQNFCVLQEKLLRR
ncbi:PTS sugar transporter subunit IIA [Candidatus Enterococcus ferrettii]|uniref:PTS system, mannose-specific IIA component n=1 Tax=Candidatus Enterococcus ferrettii TaxID=2815324 RepID=A0ABV0EKQ6_9ENTE|nr:PTS sugar transporter subunit IIA [Enterococcus sp. 665A]MBO1340926.1 PTS sugar transporter subunit IIA [Enterococcus sp. 665A]